MHRSVMRVVLASGLLLGVALTASASAEPAKPLGSPSRPTGNARYDQERKAINSNVVYIAAGAPSATYARIAEDIQTVLEDPQAREMRVLPTMSHGGGQNFVDMLLLYGIDLALVEQDHLRYFLDKDPELYKNLEQRVRYITKLYNSEFHILAKSEITDPAMLKGKKVNFFKEMSSSAITAENVFRLLGISVEPTFYDDAAALLKLKSGEISAIARIGGAPLPTFASVKPEDGLHFVALDEQSDKYAGLLAVYAPTLLKSDLYPNLIPKGKTVLSIANATVLITCNWPEKSERYQRVARFVDRFFDRFDQFNQPPRHPKWKEVNLAAGLVGWQRFPAAKQWLDRHSAVSSAGAQRLKREFEDFVDDYAKTSSMTPEQRDATVKGFIKWYDQKYRK
jgi:uncharacterized protein